MSRQLAVILVISALILFVFVYFMNSNRASQQVADNGISQNAPVQVSSALQKVDKMTAENDLEGALTAIDGYLDDTGKVSSDFEYAVDLLLAKADILRKQNKPVKAKDIYKKIYENYPNSVSIAKVQKNLEDLNMKILFSKFTDKDLNDIIYEVKPGDSLDKIAREYNTTVGLIKKSNRLESDLIRVGDNLKISGAKFSVLIDKSLNQLFLKANDQIFKTYAVSTGKENSTPEGEFKIINKLQDPVWYKAGAIVPPESEDNILGSRWMGLTKLGYGIHGTTEPEKIGQSVTQGCVRMRNEDVEELYSILPVDTEVTIIE